ncbi:MAG TPA: Trm112 family protein [Chthoniobacteraceae bacterium]|nr:Trm112 family protein [Chthoniobacteraceae bacterium]
MSEFAELLRCPETRQKLAVAPSSLLDRMRADHAAGKLFHVSGKPVAEPLVAGLVSEDGRRVYPVVDGIPVMLKDDAVLL